MEVALGEADDGEPGARREIRGVNAGLLQQRNDDAETDVMNNAQWWLSSTASCLAESRGCQMHRSVCVPSAQAFPASGARTCGRWTA